MAVLLQLAVLGPAKLNKSQRSLGSSDNIETPGTQIGTLQARIPQATTSFQRGGFRDSTYSSMSSGSRGDTTTTIVSEQLYDNETIYIKNRNMEVYSTSLFLSPRLCNRYTQQYWQYRIAFKNYLTRTLRFYVCKT